MSEPVKATRRGRAFLLLIALLLILLIGGAFRFTNINWDKGTYHIHPDERYTTMVVTAIRWPSSLGEYFDTSRSPLNPRNNDYVYFYGTLPLFLTKLVATEIDRALDWYAATRPTVPDWMVGRALLAGYDRIHLVGRVLSALFDLGSVLLLFFFGRRLFDWRVGLAASFLLALAVLDIQGSHYFAVDTFLTFFVLLTLWTLLDVAEGKGWPAFVGLGLSMGLTLACKVSVFLLVVVVVLAAWLRVRQRAAQGQAPGRATLAALGGLLLAAAVALGVFRVAQPYAWAGPNYTGWDSVPEPYSQRLRILEKIPEPLRAVFMPNPRWIADILEAGAQQTGEADVPWGQQWTERPAWIFPLSNTVVWGMGVPLGVAACAGLLLILYQLCRAWWKARRRSPDPGDAPLSATSDPPSAAVDPQSAIRHPPSAIGHPPFAICHPPSAIRHPPSAIRHLALLPLAWVLLTFFWQGMQFVKSMRYFLPLYPCLALFAAYLVVSAWDGARRRRRGARLAVGALAAAVLLGTLAWALAFVQIYRSPVTRVQATRWIYDNIPQGATIAVEHYDDPLPFNMFGYNAFGAGGMYRGVELTNYWEDNPEKLDKLLGDLDQSDYIVMSSGRLSTSITRLPMRYPMTSRYYRLLLAGQLGFEKAAEFHSYPRLFGFEFDDDSAEEQFTVYDHPKVLIYHKTAAYDREQVQALLSEGIDWGSVATGLRPRDVPKWKREHKEMQRALDKQQEIQQGKNNLMLTEAQRQVQEQGGTWASIFRRGSLPNRLPTLAWLVGMAVLGLAALPLTVGVFRWLPDRGYILARPAGVLLLAWLSWILTNLTPLHYSRGTIGLAFGLIALASAATLALPGQRRRLRELWHTQKRMILVTEALFLAFFAILWLTRWGNPDLWHAWRGGEKPMDFAYLNAVIKSTEFPPYDPWFAGGYLNYYYFGQVMVGTVIKLIGIVPSVAYNLVIPTWFAMTAMGAFSVTYNLVAHPPSVPPAAAGEKPRRLSPILFGILGALFVVVVGNLAEIHLILLRLSEGALESFKSTIPGLVSLVRFVVGSFEVMFGGKALPIGLQEWYWNATRAIPPGEAYGITEFPFFTFLFADLHAHLIAMPLTFLSMSAALAVVQRRRSEAPAGTKRSGWRGWMGILGLLLLWALTIGAMRTTNAWDVPPHLLVALGALVIGEASRRRRSDRIHMIDRIRRMPALQPTSWESCKSCLKVFCSVAWQFGLVFVLGWAVLFQPFWAHYGSFYNSLAVWTGTRTPLWAYLVVHGLFVFAIVSYLAVRAFGRTGGHRPDALWRKVRLTVRCRNRRQRLRKVAQSMGVRCLPVSRWIWLGLATFVLLELLFLIPGLVPFTRPQAETIYGGGYDYRGLSVWALGLPAAALGLLLLFRPRISPTERLWAYLALAALAMTMGVEVIVLQGDVARMNTVFKFYVQVWLFWGVAAAAALAWIVPRVRRSGRGRTVWLGVLGVLLVCAALYPPLATSARVRDRFDPTLGPGLDGWEYMTTAHYYDPNGQDYDLKWDYEAILWMLDNVVGSPTIMEGQVPEYRWGARYSVNTGLPTVLGWNWHQRQQRGSAGDKEVWARASDIETCYNTPFPADAMALLDKYQVQYVIVGPLERAYYTAGGLSKFDQMVGNGQLSVVYRTDGVTIYEVPR